MKTVSIRTIRTRLSKIGINFREEDGLPIVSEQSRYSPWTIETRMYHFRGRLQRAIMTYASEVLRPGERISPKHWKA